MSGAVSLAVLYGLSNLTAPASGRTHGAKFTVSTGGAATATIPLAGFVQKFGDFQPQSAMVDNTANAQAVTVQETQFGWTRTVPAGVSRTFNFPAVSYPNFILTTGGPATVYLTLFDFPSFPDASDSNGSTPQSVDVTNPVTVILPAPYSVNLPAYHASLSGSSASTSQVVGTAGLTTYLLGFDFSVTEDATLAVAAANAFTLQTAAPLALWKQAILIPTAASSGRGLLAGPIGRKFDYPFLPNLGTQPTIEILSAAALVTGSYNCNVYLVDM